MRECYVFRPDVFECNRRAEAAFTCSLERGDEPFDRLFEAWARTLERTSGWHRICVNWSPLPFDELDRLHLLWPRPTLSYLRVALAPDPTALLRARRRSVDLASRGIPGVPTDIPWIVAALHDHAHREPPFIPDGVIAAEGDKLRCPRVNRRLWLYYPPCVQLEPHLLAH